MPTELIDDVARLQARVEVLTEVVTRLLAVVPNSEVDEINGALSLWLVGGMPPSGGSPQADAYVAESKRVLQQLVLRAAEERSRRDTRGARA